MRDFAQKWSPFPDWREAQIAARNWQARVVTGLSQTLVSGALERAWESLQVSQEVGLWGLAPEERPYRVRIARDRALVVSPSPLELKPGWQAAGWAASRADNARMILEVEGPALPEIIAEGTSADLSSGSPSASVLFAGLQGVLLYRTAPDRARLHVEAPSMPYLWHWLETR